MAMTIGAIPTHARRLAAALAAGALLTGGATFVTALRAADTAAAPARSAGNPDLWLEARLEPAAPYVQAQALYTLRLYQAIGVRELQFHAPAAPLADIRPLAGDHVVEVTRDGRRYRVTERRYAVFPFASGEQVLSGAHVTGQVTVPGALPAATAALRLDPPPTPIDVLPIPPNAGTAAWLPARTLTLSETWTPDPADARAGQALRRTVRIEAEGLDAAQLPALDPVGEGFSAHAEAPRLDNHFDGTWNIGTREQSWLIVPARAGTLELPTLQLPWWDVLANRPRNASLPARTLAIAAALPTGAAAAAPAALMPGAGDTPATAPAPTPAPASSSTAPHDTVATPALITAPALAAVLALAGWRGVIRRRRTAAWRALRSACRRNDPRAAHRALLALAAVHWPDCPPRSAGELARRAPGTAASAALLALDRRLYGPAAAPWDGRALLASLPPKSAGGVRAARLPPLYDR